MIFKVLSRDYLAKEPEQQFSINKIEANNSEKAWEEVEATIETNTSHSWLLTPEEFDYLGKLLSK